MSPNVLCVITKLYLTTTETKHTQLITPILFEKGRGIGMAFATEKKKLTKKNWVVIFQNLENLSFGENSLEGQAEGQTQVKDQGLLAISFLLSLKSFYFF